MAHIVKKAVQIIEHRVSTQAVNLKDVMFHGIVFYITLMYDILYTAHAY